MGIPMWAFYALLLVLAVALAYKLHKVMVDTNPIEWWHFIASKGKDGEYYADITKLGQAAGILLVVWLAIAMSARVTTIDWVGFCAILALCLAYLSGVQAYQAYLKSKRDDKVEVKETVP